MYLYIIDVKSGDLLKQKSQKMQTSAAAVGFEYISSYVINNLAV